MDYESWRCSRDDSKFCPIEGCPAWYGCARDHGWKPGDPSPRECQNMAAPAATPPKVEPDFAALAEELALSVREAVPASASIHERNRIWDAVVEHGPAIMRRAAGKPDAPC